MINFLVLLQYIGQNVCNYSIAFACVVYGIKKLRGK